MNRRDFLRLLGWGLAAGWAGGRLAWPRAAAAGTEKGVRLALLGDAHLRDGDDRRPAARALARAVAEIRALNPAPDLVLFAGDLADRRDPQALALGKEILADLPAPLFMVMGEGDGLPDEAGPWRRLFGEPRFSHSFPFNPPSPQPSPPWGEREKLWSFFGQGPANFLPKTENRKQKTIIQVLGLHTSWCPGPAGPGFYVGEAGRGWLAQELARLDPDAPLVVLSHAPLARVFRPWQQWTGDAPQVAALLARFRQVFCVHGHVHRHEGISENFAELQQEYPPPLTGAGWGEGEYFTPTLTLPPQGGGKIRMTGPPGIGDQGSGLRGQSPGVRAPGSGVTNVIDWGFGSLSENRKLKTENHLFHQGLPATAWPRPLALIGTPAALRPGLGPRGCGWGLISIRDGTWHLFPKLWSA